MKYTNKRANTKKHKSKRSLLILSCTLLLAFITPFMISKQSQSTVVYATCCVGGLCPNTMCEQAVAIIAAFHALAENKMKKYITNEFDLHEEWMTDTFFKQHILRAMQWMTQQMVATAYQQMLIIGTFMDIKDNFETQRDLQELRYQSHKDYQPSTGFCTFGTNVRSLSGSDSLARFNKQALDEQALKRMVGSEKTSAAGSRLQEKTSRWNQFVYAYCDSEDNNYNVYHPTRTGLEQACGSAEKGSAEEKNRLNKDISYNRTIEMPRTINADFTKDDPGIDGEDVLALSANLFGHDIFTRQLNLITQKPTKTTYMDIRALAAKRGVALNSFNAITALKTSGTTDKTGHDSAKTAEYMGKILENLGIPEEEVAQMLGQNPSYYAQLETLAKKVVQDPDFYSDLYDKPANVKRKAAALKALELMIDREIYNSQIRREMLLSVLLSNALYPEEQRIEAKLKYEKK